jgi:hypothetical protein
MHCTRPSASVFDRKTSATAGGTDRIQHRFPTLYLTVGYSRPGTVRVFEKAFQTSGWHGVWREWIKRLDTVGGITFDGALYNAQLGTIKYLEAIYKQRGIWMTYLRVEPRLDPLRDDPRFQDLLRRVEGR